MSEQSPRITLKYVHWMWPCLGSDDARFYLHGIAIEPLAEGGCVLMATDGHVMMVIHDKDAWAARPLIWKPSASLRRAASAVVPDLGNECVVSLESPMWGDEIKEAKIVDWRKAIPAEPLGSGAPAFDIEKLMAFRNVPRFMTKTVVRGSGTGNPALLLNFAAPEFFGVVMPLLPGKISPECMNADQSWILPAWAQRSAMGADQASADAPQGASA